MKIARITTSNKGGAGLCVQRLHNASVLSGNNETLILRSGEKSDNSIVFAEEDAHIPCYTNSGLLPFCYRRFAQFGFLGKTHYYIHKLSRLSSKRYFFATCPVSFYKSLCYEKEVQEADIINLHWIGDFVDIPSFFNGVKKPIVWSLHDENPARGCLHYDCPYPEYNRIDDRFINCKKQWLKKVDNLHIVVQSKYMAEVCKKSKVLSRFPTTIINNGVDVTLFVKKDKQKARTELGIGKDRKVFLFSSLQIDDERKGLHKLISALERINDTQIMLICVGRYKSVPKTDIDVLCVGYITDNDYYSTLYSASDYFVLASSQESFAKTPLEAMACGTPVIAFPCSGIEDCITNDTGIICKGFSVDDLYLGISEASSKQYDRSYLREYVSSNFTFDIMSKRYNSLYAKILAENK